MASVGQVGKIPDPEIFEIGPEAEKSSRKRLT